MWYRTYMVKHIVISMITRQLQELISEPATCSSPLVAFSDSNFFEISYQESNWQ